MGPQVRQIRFGPEILPSSGSPTVRTRCGIAGRTDPNRASCSPHRWTAWPGASRVWSCRLSRPCAHPSSFGKARPTTCGLKEVSQVEGRFTTHSRPMASRGRSTELRPSPVRDGTGPSWPYRWLSTPTADVGAAIIDTPQGRRAYYTGSDDSRIQIGLGVEAPGFSPTGSYLSRVFDSGVRNTWNRVSVNVTLPPNSDVVAFLRTGETVQPDATWSGWQTVDPSSGAVGPLRGRYAQYLLSLSTFEAVDTPVVHDVSVIYQLNFGPTGIPRDPANESWVAVDTPVLKWSSSDPEGDRQVSFQIDLSREASFGTIAHSSGTVSSTTTEWQALSLEEGLWYWR